MSYVNYCVRHPARYHLMFQRTIPGFAPAAESHDIALTALRELVQRLAAAGIVEDADLCLVRSLLSGIAAEQTANDPRGRLFADQTERGVRALLQEIRSGGQASERGRRRGRGRGPEIA